VTRPVKDRSGVGLPPKAERRQLGKLAAKKRAQAKRRKRILNNAAVVASGLAVVALLLFLFGVFDSDDPAASPQASASASANTNVGTDPALQTKPTVTAGTGELTELKVTPLITGTGPAVQNGQSLMVNYVGVNYVTGEEFDTSFGKPAFTFTIGRGEVIKGWEQGLVGVTVGSRVQLDIPADLAYGDTGGGATSGPLRFVVDVLSASPGT
jgi:peptidylprolyl isomerase